MAEKKLFSRADARKMATRLRKSEEWSVERVRATGRSLRKPKTNGYGVSF